MIIVFLIFNQWLPFCSVEIDFSFCLVIPFLTCVYVRPSFLISVLYCRSHCCVNQWIFLSFYLSFCLFSSPKQKFLSSSCSYCALCDVPEISRTCGFILDKSDTAFTRSRSSSTSSLENHPNETVTTLTFADTLARKLGLSFSLPFLCFDCVT